LGFGVAQPPSLADSYTFRYKHGLEIKVALRQDFLAQWLSYDLGGNGSIGWEFGPETPLQLLAQLGNFHSWHDNELTTQHFPGLIVIGQLARNTAILAILIPAKTAIGYRFRADELEASEKRIALRHLKLLAHHGDVHELFIRSKGFRHDQSCLPWTGCRVSAEVARDGSL